MESPDIQAAAVECGIRELQLELATAKFREKIARKLRTAYMHRCRMLEARCVALEADVRVPASEPEMACSVCMVRPLAWGFAHARGDAHVNLCEPCATAHDWSRCPSCREPGTLVKLFYHGVPQAPRRETNL